MARTYLAVLRLSVLASCEIPWELWSYNLVRKAFVVPEPCT